MHAEARAVKINDDPPLTSLRAWLAAVLVTLLVAVVAFLFAVVQPATSAGVLVTPSASGSIGDICQAAARAIAADRPQLALDLIANFRSSAPSSDDAAAPTENPCVEASRLAAIGATAAIDLSDATATPTPSSFAQVEAVRWDKAVERNVIPLFGPLSAAVGLLVVLLVIARLVAFSSRFLLPRPDPKLPNLLVWIGVPFLLVGAIAAIGTFGLAVEEFAWFFVGLGCAVVGALLVGVGFANRLRLDVKVHTKDESTDGAETNQLVSYLWDIGGKPPSGLEIPVGTDVEVLSETALISESDNKVVALIYTIAQFVVGSAPWKVSVDIHDADALTLHVRRNGRNMKSIVIRRGDYPSLASRAGLAAATKEGTAENPAPSDLKRMAAAAVLISLSENYRGFEGLVGATSWKSVGLQYIASADYVNRDNDAIPVLAEALEYDSGNRLARLSMQVHRFRIAHSSGDLRYYARWLEYEYEDTWRSFGEPYLQQWRDGTAISTVVTQMAYKMRIAYNYAAAVINLRSASGNALERPTAHRMVADLDRMLNLEVADPQLVAQMRPTIEIFARIISRRFDGIPPEMEDSTAMSTSDAFNRGSELALASRARRESGQALAAEAMMERSVALITYGVIDSENKTWVKKDPTFLSMRGYPTFDKLVGFAPRSDYWDLPLFADVKEKLQAEGVDTPARLARVAASRMDLSSATGIPLSRLSRLSRVSTVIVRAEERAHLWPHDAANVYRVELVAEVVARGLESGVESSQLAVLSTEIVAAVRERAGKADPDDARAWELRVREWLAGVIR
jgi:hypothetical protein